MFEKEEEKKKDIRKVESDEKIWLKIEEQKLELIERVLYIKNVILKKLSLRQEK